MPADRTGWAPGRNLVSYDSEGSRIAAHLFLPGDFDPGRSYPAIVFVRPATGVKEQTAGLYAEQLAARGFVTLAFDARGFGESEGRRQLEDPRRVVQDVRNSITFVAGLPFVGPRNIFSAGVCMGGSYAPVEAAGDPRVKAVASITPYLTFQQDYTAASGGAVVTRVLAALTDAVVGTAAALGFDLFWFAVPPNRLVAALPLTMDINRDMRVYYLEGQPGHRPTWRNRINVASNGPLLAYDPLPVARSLGKPYYMAYGTRGYSPRLLQQFFDQVPMPATDKRLRVLEAQHFEIYWKPQFVQPIVEDLDIFFRSYVE